MKRTVQAPTDQTPTAKAEATGAPAPPVDPHDCPPDRPGLDALPGTVFYAALLPALKANGIAPTAGRQEWPLEVLRDVFRVLSSKAPRWLLEKEIWATSTATTDWWSRSRTYSRSLAVMSVVGYVIGLGDRCNERGRAPHKRVCLVRLASMPPSGTWITS